MNDAGCSGCCVVWDSNSFPHARGRSMKHHGTFRVRSPLLGEASIKIGLGIDLGIDLV